MTSRLKTRLSRLERSARPPAEDSRTFVGLVALLQRSERVAEERNIPLDDPEALTPEVLEGVDPEIIEGLRLLAEAHVSLREDGYPRVTLALKT